MTAKLIRLRLNRDGISKGLTGQHVNVFHINHAGKVIAFKRWFDGGVGDECVVIANFANQHYDDYEFGLPSAGLWKRRFSSDRRAWSEDFGGGASGDIEAISVAYDRQPFRGKIRLPPYTLLIYSQG